MSVREKKQRTLGAINGARDAAELSQLGVPGAEAAAIVAARNGIPGRQFQSLEQVLNLVPSARLKSWYDSFLPKCREDRPVLLLPLRLETRVVDGELRIRFYPDDVLLDSHDPQLTRTELSAGNAYLAARVAALKKGDSDAVLDAWRTLSASVGPARAAWIARTADSYDIDSDPRQAAESWADETRLGPMPDRFAVLLYNTAGNLAHPPIRGNFVIPGLRVLGGSQESGLLDSTSRWVSDYEAALACGMGVSVELDALELGNDKQLSRIVVVGLKRQTPEESQDDLGRLLESHHYSGGLAFTRQGTPTNNTTSEKSGYSTSEDHDRSFSIEVDEIPGWDSDLAAFQHNAHRLGTALGFGPRPDVFKHLHGAGDRSEDCAGAMNAALWPALGDYFLRSMIPGVVSSQHLDDAHDHFSRFVRAGGPLPALRIGRQPYGVLPVTRIDRASDGSRGWAPSETDIPSRLDFDSGLHAVLSRCYERWAEYATDPARVPRIGGSSDPEQELLEILSMQPVSVEVAARPMLDRDFAMLCIAAVREQVFGDNTSFAQILTGNNPKQWLARWRDRWQEEVNGVVRLLASISGLLPIRFQQIPIRDLFGWWTTLDPGPLTSMEGEKPDEYLKALCAGNANTQANTLLHDLLKRSLALESKRGGNTRAHDAICRLASATVLDFLNNAPDAETIVSAIGDDPAKGAGPPRAYGVRPSLARRILEERDRVPGRRFTSLAQVDAIYGVGKDTYHDILHAFRGPLVSSDIDLLFRQTLDLLSHRLDAWLTSLATKRLEAMRTRTENGVHLGAFGYLENLDLSGASVESAGYIHTPSAGQTAAAAVLYSACLSHEAAPDGKHPFHLNLTSGRVNRALQLLDGVREGQSLGALLGYQFERGLHLGQNVLDQYIDDFRTAFPIVADKLTESADDEAVEAMAARNVVDGAALARAWRAVKEADESPSVERIKQRLNGVLPPEGSTEGAGIRRELDRLLDGTDAVGDALMFESIYHAASENFEAAGAALDAATGKGHPPRLSSLSTRVNASALDHRVVMLLPTSSADGGSSPRSEAEPTLASWLGAHFPPLDQVGCSYLFTWREQDVGEQKPLDINQASAEDLETLPGIGRERAGQIVRHRRASGNYQSVRELLEADDIDIGDVTFGKIRGRVTCGSTRVSLADLGISALDFFYLSVLPLQGEETEIEQRVRRIARMRDAIPLDQRIEIELTRPEGCTHGFDEAAEVARTAFALLSQATVLDPSVLAAPTDMEAAHHDIGDARLLRERVRTARDVLEDLRRQLDDSLPEKRPDGGERDLTLGERDAIDSALLEISRFGVPGAFGPGPEDPGLLVRARGVLADVARRIQEVPDPTVPDASLPGTSLDLLVRVEYIEALKTLFGRAFIVLPSFVPASLGPIRDSLQDPELLGNSDQHRVRLWLQQEAEVHPALERLEDWLLISEAWGQTLPNLTGTELGVVQLPHEADRRWLALADEERDGQRRDRDALSIVMAGSDLAQLLGDRGSTRVSGFVIHRCQDRVPGANVDTSVGFHYDAPSAQAPQCLLLAVPAKVTDPPGAWSEGELAAIVMSAMDLAKIRAVDLDALGVPAPGTRSDSADAPRGFGAFIPALFMPVDPSRQPPSRSVIAETMEQWLGPSGDPG